jgi:hypothetical protein
MFLPQACDFIEAVDATDGTLLWEYRRAEVDHIASLSCANRNATIYKDQLIIATRDAYLVSLNAPQRRGNLGASDWRLDDRSALLRRAPSSRWENYCWYVWMLLHKYRMLDHGSRP